MGKLAWLALSDDNHALLRVIRERMPA